MTRKELYETIRNIKPGIKLEIIVWCKGTTQCGVRWHFVLLEGNRPCFPCKHLASGLTVSKTLERCKSREKAEKAAAKYLRWLKSFATEAQRTQRRK